QEPQSMEKETVRHFEIQALGLIGDMREFDAHSFFTKKLKDVQADGVNFHFIRDDNSFSKIDIGHIPSAIGVLIARLIYPSYGIMLIFARLANLLFFALSIFALLKHSKIGKWGLFMLFTVPFIQKMASPSYDVFSYIAVSAFTLNLFALAKQKSLASIKAKEYLYTFFTIALLFLAKNNYIFALVALPFLPAILNPIIHYYRTLSLKYKLILWIIAVLLSIFTLCILNNIFDLKNF